MINLQRPPLGRIAICFSIAACLAIFTNCSSDHSHSHDHDGQSHDHDHDHDHAYSDAPKTIEELKIENLLRDRLALAEDVEVIVSYLETPTNTTLPRHYHPGEEFVYILEGSGDLYVEDEHIELSEGDLYKIPLEAVHSFSTTDEEARAVVFRVHKPGQPDRILVEDE